MMNRQVVVMGQCTWTTVDVEHFVDWQIFQPGSMNYLLWYQHGKNMSCARLHCAKSKQNVTLLKLPRQREKTFDPA